MNKIKIIVSFLLALLETILAQNGKMLWVTKILELEAKTDISQYSKDITEWVGLTGVLEVSGKNSLERD